MTSQQFKKELQESGGVNEIFIPQKNESFAEGLKQTGSRLRDAIFIMLNSHILFRQIAMLIFSPFLGLDPT